MAIKGAYTRAVLLITVFSMNVVIGSACSLSEMFHQAHHHNDEASAAHGHADGTTHSHDHDGAHHDAKEKDDACCSRFTVEFNQFDKSFSHHLQPILVELPREATTDFYNAMSLLSRKDASRSTQHDRRRRPPTIPDLRIVIQSFQI